MSNTVKPLDFSPVGTIGLNSSNYGEEINKRFETIDDNFSLIDRVEYWKGATGDSINVYECIMSSPSSPDANTSAYNEGTIYTKSGDRVTKGSLYEMVSNAITSGVPEYGLNRIGIDPDFVNWYDNFDKMNKILLICQSIKGKDYVISSMPYSYIDARFANINWKNKEAYTRAYDVTSYLGWDASTDKIVKLSQNQTLYYNDEIETFCWIINGSKTNIPANGVQGESGHNGIVYIVQPEQTNSGQDIQADENGQVAIGSVFVFKDGKYSFAPITEAGVEIADGDTAICFYTEYTDNEPTTYFVISPMYKNNDGRWYVFKDLSNSITTIYNTQVLKTALLTLSTSKVLPGLFVPASNYDSNGRMMGHMIWVDEDNINNTQKKVVNVSLVDNVSGENKPTPYSGDIESIMNVNYDVFVKGDVTANQVTVGDPTGTYLTITPESFKMSGVEFDSQSGTVPGDLTVGGNASIAGSTNINGKVTAGGAEIGSMTTLNNVTINGSITNKEYAQMKKEIEWFNSVYDITASKSNTPTLSKVARHIHVYSPGGERYHVKLMTKSVLETKRKQIYGDNPLSTLVFYIISNGEIELDDSSDVTWVRNAWDKGSHEVKGMMTCVWNGSTLQTYY